MLKPSRSLYVAIPVYEAKLPFYLHNWLCDIRSAFDRAGIRYIENLLPSIPQLSVGRSQLFAEYLDSGFDDLLFIDGDMCGTLADVLHIQALPYGAVSGMYMDRHSVRLMANMTDYPDPAAFSTDHIFEGTYVPMGFFKIRYKEALELYFSMRDDWPIFNRTTMSGRPHVNVFAQGMYPSLTNTGTWWHDEDYAFSWHYRERVGRIYIDRRLRITHAGLEMPKCIHIPTLNQI